MKLLITTQKVDINNDVLGFFHDWLLEFAKQVDEIIVICLGKGEYDLPGNVRVLSLGKEEFGIGNLELGICYKFFYKFKFIFRFYKLIWEEKGNYDAVFVHMNPEYAVLGGMFWKCWDKKIGLWYTHKKVGTLLRIAEKFVDVIFTASELSFRLPSKKVKVVGHGINLNKFRIKNYELRIKEEIKIITVGRISPVKDYETLIEAAEILKNDNISFAVNIIGGPATENDKKYFEKLQGIISQKNLVENIKLIGPVANKNIIKYFEDADLFINLSHTGSLDKAILEAMAASVPVITCNEAAFELFGEYKNELSIQKKNPADLVERIKNFIELPPDKKDAIANQLKRTVERDHNLENLIIKITRILNGDKN